MDAAHQKILTPDALAFVLELEAEFGPIRERLLQARIERQHRIDKGQMPDFLPETRSIRESDWKVAPAPKDLQDRRVEITGPAEPKMIINALNSSANVFMADLEDSLSPTWNNVLAGQSALYDAVRGRLEFKSPEGKHYSLGTRSATLKVRPRGWHLVEKNIEVRGKPISASLFDFGLFFFHNAKALLDKGSGPYFYLPKMESHLEARLWNDVFAFSQERLGIPYGSIRATMLIETILAAFEMEEMLYELRDHASGLNAGRWDYIFSLIKKLRMHPNSRLPDRAQITMAVPFMSAYAKRLVATCHKRNAHAMGGMSAFIPSRKDPEVNRIAFEKVREDKKREATLGFDGTWIAHPDLASIANEEFSKALGASPHQKGKTVDPSFFCPASALIDTRIEGAKITESGVRGNISVALQYLYYWLNGTGAVAIHNLMEDAATAEISRAQLWQWLKLRARLDDGREFAPDVYRRWKTEERSKLSGLAPSGLEKAERLLDSLVMSDDFEEFLTLPAYAMI